MERHCAQPLSTCLNHVSAVPCMLLHLQGNAAVTDAAMQNHKSLLCELFNQNGGEGMVPWKLRFEAGHCKDHMKKGIDNSQKSKIAL